LATRRTIETTRRVWLRQLSAAIRRGQTETVIEQIRAMFASQPPLEAAGARAAVYEALAQQFAAKTPQVTRTLYDLAIEDLRIWASGASGQGEGLRRTAEVREVQARRAALGETQAS
jgi:hypothetical protein